MCWSAHYSSNSDTHKSKVLFYVKIHVQLPQVFTILREYSRNLRSAKFHIWRENSRYNCS